MKSLIFAVASLSLTGLVLGCSSSVDTGPVDLPYDDLTGVYRTDSINLVPSITAVEVFNGNSDIDLEAVVLRNGLSDAEYAYFNELNEVQFVDSTLGRAVTLKNFKEDKTVKNERLGDLGLLNVCSDKVELNSRSMDLQYCLYMVRQSGSLKADGELVLNIFEFGEKVHEIKTPFTVFIKDRWFVDYFGSWSGELQYMGGNAGGLNLDSGQTLEFLFQPVTETEYILRPADVDHSLTYLGERYVLMPETREMTDLEESANPYINIVYVSEVDGARQVHFNSYVRQSGVIEGNVTAVERGRTVRTLGTYSLEQE